MINDIEFDDTFDLSNGNILNFRNKGYQDFSRLKNQGKVYKGETIRGMTHVLPFVEMPFTNRSSTQVEQYYFPDAKKTNGKNLKISFDVDSPTNLTLDKLIEENFYLDVNKNERLDSGDIPYKMILFISKNGNKVKETYEVTKPNKDEIIFFIEDQTGDYFSNQLIYGKIAPELRSQFLELSKSKTIDFSNSSDEFKKYVDVSKNIFLELINQGKIENKVSIPYLLMNGINYIFKSHFYTSYALGYALDLIGKGISELKISDTIWDTENENYLFEKSYLKKRLSIDTHLIETFKQTLADKQTHQLIKLLPANLKIKMDKTITIMVENVESFNAFIEKTIDDIYDSDSAKTLKFILEFKDFHETLAFLCGIYNGLIDFIASTISFIGDIFKAPKAIVDNWVEITETLDNALEFFRNVDWSGDMLNAFAAIYNKIKIYLSSKESDDFNYIRIAYVCGFALAFIGTLFIPFANIARVLSSIGKVGKFGSLLADMLQGFQKGTATLAQAGKQGIRQMLKFIDDFLVMLKTGGEKLIKFLDDIWKKIADWFLKNKKTFTLVDDLDDVLLALVRILKKNASFVDSIDYIKQIRRPLGKWIALESEAMVNLYTKSTYILLNKALRGLDNIKLTKEFQAMQKLLDDALIKLPAFNQGSEPLYRSIRFSEEQIKKLFKVGNDYIDKGFFSTTYSESALLKWMQSNPSNNVLIKVYGKNGKLIEKSSAVSHEAEVLFKSGTEFVVVTIEKYFDKKLMREITEIILKEK